MHHVLIWLLVVELMGLIALPLTFSLFRRLPDRGLIFSKVLALLLSSYILWVLGLTHIAPNSRYTIIAILLGLALVAAFVLWRKLPEITSFIRREWFPLLTAELVFLAFFFLWIAVVSAAPAINHTEKPMDFAFLNAILRSDHFPPEDPWLSGHSISYYYFGHFMMALLTKLTAIPSAISYNLSIALIPALLGAGAFSLVYNLIRVSGARANVAVAFALVAPVLIALIGNLEGVLELVSARGWGSDGFWEWVSIKSHVSSATGKWVLLGLGGGQGADPGLFPNDHLWWWHATRLIDTVVDGSSLDYTITEFPFFSFLLGDLHPHVSSLPFLILILALGLNLFVSRERLGLGWLRRNPWEVAAITLSLGSLAFLNIWDFPVFAAVVVALVLVKGYGDWGGQFRSSILPSLTLLVPVLVGAVVLFIPFYMTLGSQASGIRVLGDVSTQPVHFFLMWGLFMLLSGAFLIRQLWTLPSLRVPSPGALSTVLVIMLLPFLMWAAWRLFLNPADGGIAEGVGARFGKLLPGLAVAGAAFYSMLLRAKHDEERATAFSLLPLALGLYLLVGVELFYLIDFFGNRMNTVFKAYYQAWLLLAIVSAYGLYYVHSGPMRASPASDEEPPKPSRLRLGTPLKYGWLGLVVLVVLASFYYPVGAALDRTKGSGAKTLDGLAFLQAGRTGEYEAIRWLQNDAPWGRMVEAVGDDYTEYGRISSSTGLPTVLGWRGHEHQWRGSTSPFRGREEDVAQIYRSGDPDQVRTLLDTYDIRYVYVGARERAKYGQSKFDNFSSLLRPVCRTGDVVIYERLQDGQLGVNGADDRPPC